MADASKTTLELPVKTSLANNATDRILFLYNAANTTAAQTASIVANTLLRTLSMGPPGMAVVDGGVNGNITVTSIHLGDRLDEVIEFVIAEGAMRDIVDLTSEFTISANNTINNTDGTDTTENKLLVRWTKLI